MGALANLSLAEHTTLGALCNGANANAICRPSVERIAKKDGIEMATIRECIKILAARGLPLVIRTAGRANTYRLTMPDATPSGSGADHDQ
jgi:hypothetical protein